MRVVEDFIRAHGERVEFARGMTIEKPLPNRLHSDCNANIGVALQSYGRMTGFGKPRPQWHHRFGPADDIRIYVPDIVFVFTKDRPQPPEYATAASELMIEIYSPSTDPADLLDKLHFYLANGAKSVWLVYPAKRRVDVFKPSAPTKTFTGDAVLTDPLLPGFELPLAELFE